MIQGQLVESYCVVDAEGCAANVVSALARSLPVCSRGPRRTGRLAIVGSAPSVLDYLDELRAWPGEVWAVNGAWRRLRELGVKVHGFVGMDPVAGLAEYVEPDAGTTFFLSSVCDPSVFDKLAGEDVWLWHSKCAQMPYPPHEMVVGGGTTTLSRAPFLAQMLGWRGMTMFGCDCSFGEARYCYEQGTFKEDNDRGTIKVQVGDRTFETTQDMMKQVPQFEVTAQILQGRLTFRCGGLLAAYLEAPVQELSDIGVEYVPNV